MNETIKVPSINIQFKYHDKILEVVIDSIEKAVRSVSDDKDKLRQLELALKEAVDLVMMLRQQKFIEEFNRTRFENQVDNLKGKSEPR